MKRVLAILITLLPIIAMSQVRVASAAKTEKKVVPYDSISNNPKDPYGLVGQELFLLPKPEQLRQFEYDIYPSDQLTGKKPSYESVAMHTFEVVEVIKQESRFSSKDVLKLRDLKTDSIYYIKYEKRESLWPYLILGYKAKFEAENKGKKFHVLLSHLRNFDTGDKIEKSRGSVWTFQEIIALEDRGEIGYLFQNSKGETVALTKLDMDHFIFPKSRMDQLIKKYGQAMCNTALAGEIKIGMPKELVKVAWGEPDKINNSSYDEQWVYGETHISCVYFKNGKVSGWN